MIWFQSEDFLHARAKGVGSTKGTFPFSQGGTSHPATSFCSQSKEAPDHSDSCMMWGEHGTGEGIQN